MSAISNAFNCSFRDVIVPKAEYRRINTQLSGFEVPEIATYSLESTIAEKFDAILQRFELTGRMKDFYDICYLAQTFDFDGLTLQTAVFETLQNRGTTYEKNSFHRVSGLINDTDMKMKWKYFLKSIKDSDLEFAAVIELMTLFLEPVYDSILAGNEWQKTWSSKELTWK